LYTYSNTSKRALAWTEKLSELKQIVEEYGGIKFNSCLLNLYHSGSMNQQACCIDILVVPTAASINTKNRVMRFGLLERSHFSFTAVTIVLSTV
jgi:hypothetical protein